MNGAARLGVYSAALVALAAGMAAIGWAAGPLERGRAADPVDIHTPEPSDAAHGATSGAGAQADGLSVAKDSLVLVPQQRVVRSGTPTPIRFTVHAGGEALRMFDVEHEREMHLIVVPRDLSGFQHLHPVRDPDGTWRAAIRLPRAGAYRAFADFATGGERTVLGWDLSAPGMFDVRPLPPPAAAARAGPFDVALADRDVAAGKESTLAFAVNRAGRVVAVDPYLGARGHLVILREGDLAYLHTHADEEELRFDTTFPSAGRYRAFLQFSAEGKVHTAAFTIEVDG